MTVDAAETTELLQQLIRNRCVNDGTPESGNELRSVDTLKQVLDAPHLEFQTYAPANLPHRASLIARLEGYSPSARVVALVAHTDVVPASPEAWRYDPFGGEVIDGEVWGRGAVDMLGQTAAMATALSNLARSSWRPTGSVVFMALADEEAGSEFGCEWLFKRHAEDMRADVVFTEIGGVQEKQYVTVGTEEKGWASIDIIVHGVSGHGSAPWATNNAIIKAACVIAELEKMRPVAHISPAWRVWIESGLVRHAGRACF